MSDPVSSSTAASLASASPFYNANEVSRIPVQVLGQDDFLKLLMAQMTAQDPLNPKKDTDFIAQMAQFSALEQSRAMQSDLAQMRTDQQVLQANALIGRLVTVQTGKDTSLAGPVTAVNVDAGKPLIVVDGKFYGLGQVLNITEPPIEP